MNCYHRAVLIVDQLTKTLATRPPRTLFQGLDFTLAAGECAAVTGESGSGKSTLLNMLAGLERPDSGRIVLDGVDLSGLDDDALTRLRRERIGFVFQAFHLLPYLNLWRNVALPLRLLGQDARQAEKCAREMLENVDLGARAEDTVTSLSGGEMQRVAIARALVHAPVLLLADEPTGNLDPDSADKVLDLLMIRTRARGASVLIVTHSELAARRADRTLTLSRDGLVAR